MDGVLDISPYRYLWDGSEPGWVLYRIETPRGSVLVPFNTSSKATLTIEDPEVARHVALRMKLAGVPVLTKAPEHA